MEHPPDGNKNVVWLSTGVSPFGFWSHCLGLMHNIFMCQKTISDLWPAKSPARIQRMTQCGRATNNDKKYVKKA